MRSVLSLLLLCGCLFAEAPGAAHDGARVPQVPAGREAVDAGQGLSGRQSNGTNIPGNTPPSSPSGRIISQPQPAEMPSPVFLRGKVVLPDGTAPAGGVVIERVCAGERFPEAYTDSTGHFSFEVGRNSQLIPDFSLPSVARSDFSMGATGRFDTWASEHPLAGCELRAFLHGYKSSIVDLSVRRRLESPDVGIIVLHRIAEVEGTTVSATSWGAPIDAQRSFEKGLKAAQKEKWEEALKQFEKAVQSYPKYAAAWYELGSAYGALGNTAEARRCYGQSLAADSKFLKSYLAIAELAMKEKNWKELADKTGRLIKLDPIDYPAAYLYNSFAHYKMNDFDAAEESARAGIGIDPEHSLPKMEHILGVILAYKRDYSGAAARFRSYLEHAPYAADVETVRKQLAEAEQGARLANSPQR